jgi:hypothetical protein
MHTEPSSDRSEPRADAFDPEALREFEQLIQRGHEILYACGWDGQRYAAFKPGGIEVLKFRARSLGLIRRVCGEESGHYGALQVYAGERRAAERGYHIKEFLDVLEAAYREYLRQRAFASEPDALLVEVGRDVIELAEALANAGCLIEAGRHAGAVLVGVLRRLGRANGIDGAGERSPAELNDALREGGVLDDAAHRRLGACLQLERDVCGPDAARIPDEELAEMVRWVRDFVLRHRSVGSRAR